MLSITNLILYCEIITSSCRLILSQADWEIIMVVIIKFMRDGLENFIRVLIEFNRKKKQHINRIQFGTHTISSEV